MSTMLASLGIEVMQGYKAEHLQPAPDCVIVGNAIPGRQPGGGSGAESQTRLSLAGRGR